MEAAEEVISVGDMLNRSSATTYASQYGKVLFKAFFFGDNNLSFGLTVLRIHSGWNCSDQIMGSKGSKSPGS